MFIINDKIALLQQHFYRCPGYIAAGKEYLRRIQINFYAFMRQGWREDRIDLSCPLQELLQLLCWRYRQEVWSEDQGTQEKSGLFHRWYTDPSLQDKKEQCNSQVSHHRPCRGREPCHRQAQGKSGRQRGTATDQINKRGTLDQEDTEVHESECRILPTQPHMGPDDFQVTCSIQL